MDTHQTTGVPLVSDDRYRLLVESIVDYAIFMLDPEGHVSSWNKGAQRAKGYTEREIIGQHFSQFYTDEDRTTGLPARALQTAAAEGRFEQEGWRVRKDGSLMWAHVVIDPIRGEDGTLIGYAKITRDLSERQAAKKALSLSEQRFRLLVQGVQDYAIYMLDPQGHIASWNRGAQRFKGYDAEEIIGEHFSRFYSEEDQAVGVPARALHTAETEGRFEAEGWRVRKDGSKFWASVVIDPIRGEHGELIGFAKITRDITERREAQQALEDTRARFIQSQKMEAIGQLTGGVAHDFNNLLTVIKSSTDLLKRPALSEERRYRYVSAISNTVDRASKLTAQLLAFARRQTLKPEVFDVGRSIAAIVDMISTLTGARIKIAVDVPEEACFINADPSQFDTAMVNLAVNARDAMDGEGKLFLSVRRVFEIPAIRAHPAITGDFVAVTITDTGSGIAADQVDQIFEPFFTTKEVGQGTGLGLSQVIGFAQQSRGEVRVESEIGQGATFAVYLPRAASAESTGSNEEPEPLVEGQGTRVLIVEDNQAVGNFSTQALSELGYIPTWARTAKEALAELARDSDRFDVVFSDVVMPVMNGVDFGHEIRRLYPNLPVILTSGYSHILAQSGTFGFELLQKPYSIEQLSRILRKVAVWQRSKRGHRSLS